MTNMSGMTTGVARVNLDKLAHTLKTDYTNAEPNREVMEIELVEWRDKVIRNNTGIKSISWDIKEDQFTVSARVVMLLEEDAASVSEIITLERNLVEDDEEETVILPGPEK